MEDEFCEKSGLERDFCAHCRNDEVPEPCEGLMIHKTIDAHYDGVCTVDDQHKITKDERIGLVSVKGEPAIRALGWACVKCVTKIRVLQANKTNKVRRQDHDWGMFA